MKKKRRSHRLDWRSMLVCIGGMLLLGVADIVADRLKPKMIPPFRHSLTFESKLDMREKKVYAEVFHFDTDCHMWPVAD